MALLVLLTNTHHQGNQHVSCAVECPSKAVLIHDLFLAKFSTAILQKPELSAGLMGHLARKQTFFTPVSAA